MKNWTLPDPGAPLVMHQYHGVNVWAGHITGDPWFDKTPLGTQVSMGREIRAWPRGNHRFLIDELSHDPLNHTIWEEIKWWWSRI